MAAGRGERLGSAQPKAFVPLAGEPMLLHAARAFEAAPSVDGLIVVVPETEKDAAGRLLGPIRKLRTVVGGGLRRQDSVSAGLDVVPSEFDGIVLIHDAARPLVDVALIESVVRAAREFGAALPVLPVVDTIKRVEGDHIRVTLDRSELAAAQTPQGFHHRLLVDALTRAQRDECVLTDEAMAVERTGAPVHTVPGSVRNRKITTPEDLRWAESVLLEEKAR